MSMIVARTPRALQSLIAFMYVAFIVVLSYNANDSPLETSGGLVQQALALGIAAGAVTAVNEVNLAVSDRYLLVRNPFLVRRIPWAAIEASVVNQGLKVKLRGTQYPLTLTAGGSLIRFSRSRPEAIKAVIDEHVAIAREYPGDSNGAQPEAHPKLSWLVIVPASTATLVLYAWFATAVFR
jgi:hypothetical protein